VLALHYLEARGGCATGGGAERRESGSDGVHPMEGTCQDEVVIGGELSEGIGEVPVVDQATSFVEDKEGEDHDRNGMDGVVQYSLAQVWMVLAVAWRTYKANMIELITRYAGYIRMLYLGYIYAP